MEKREGEKKNLGELNYSLSIRPDWAGRRRQSAKAMTKTDRNLALPWNQAHYHP